MVTGRIYQDGTYLAKYPTWHAEDSAWKARHITRMLTKHRIAPSTVCEIGCGAGEILHCLADEYGDSADFSGYEISPQAFEICRQKEQTNLHFYLEDISDREAAFDLVLVIDVIEHIENCFAFLRKVRTKGEYKLFHIPLDVSVGSVLLNFVLSSRESAGHIHYFTKESALAALKDTGYTIIDFRYTCGYTDLAKLRWRDDMLNIPRRALFKLHPDMAVRIMGRFSMLVLAK